MCIRDRHATKKMKDTIFVENFKAFNFCSNIFALKLIFSEIFVKKCQEGPCFRHKWWSSRVGGGGNLWGSSEGGNRASCQISALPDFFPANGNFGANFPGLIVLSVKNTFVTRSWQNPPSDTCAIDPFLYIRNAKLPEFWMQWVLLPKCPMVGLVRSGHISFLA